MDIESNDGASYTCPNGDRVWLRLSVRPSTGEAICITHRGGDLPAIMRANGDHEWWTDGKRHRDGDKPAIVRANGYKAWYVDGKIHRVLDDQPAIIREDGEKWWYRNDHPYREDGKHDVERANGEQEWFYGRPDENPMKRVRIV